MPKSSFLLLYLLLIFGFFFLLLSSSFFSLFLSAFLKQVAKLRMIELYNFFDQNANFIDFDELTTGLKRLALLTRDPVIAAVYSRLDQVIIFFIKMKR